MKKLCDDERNDIERYRDWCSILEFWGKFTRDIQCEFVTMRYVDDYDGDALREGNIYDGGKEIILKRQPYNHDVKFQ